MGDARQYPPLPPLKPSIDFGDIEKATPFLPVWEASTKPFFDEYAKSTPCRPMIINDTRTSTISSSSTVESSVPSAELLYQSIDIASVSPSTPNSHLV